MITEIKKLEIGDDGEYDENAASGLSHLILQAR